MKNHSPIVRLLLALWLISSQIAGAALVFGSAVVAIIFGSDVGPLLLILGYAMPVVFLLIGIVAWMMFVRSRDASAAWLGVATLIPGGVLLLVMQLV
ncbi:MAG TPA: hypothetical protein PKL78_04360 [Anaerolineales bacterium]|nr:hypothetical protein [Anaerolineales bacterium]